MRKSKYIPVRKINAGKSSLRGKHFSVKNDRYNDFESALERDFLQLLEFDRNVWYFCEQPVSIEYELEGKLHHYTPDVLVYYREDVEPANKFRPMLCEVKYRSDMKKKWTELKPKFMAALRYADAKGWRFKIITEKEVRTDYLNNVKFLSNYNESKATIDITDLELLLNLMEQINHTTPEELMLMASTNKEKQWELLFTTWYMVANGYVFCDLMKPLTIQSEIWVSY